MRRNASRFFLRASACHQFASRAEQISSVGIAVDHPGREWEAELTVDHPTAGGFGQAPFVPVADGDGGSLGCAPLRGGGSDAGAGGRGDQDRLAGQQLMAVARLAGRAGPGGP
jgi:hypothetical protein